MWNFDLLVDFYIVNATRSRLRLVTAPSVGASRYYVADVLRMSRRGVIVTDVWAPPREETGGGHSLDIHKAEYWCAATQSRCM